MSNIPDLSGARVVRLNATLFPIQPYEADLFARYGIRLIPVEVAAADDMIQHVRDADAVCVVSAKMPPEVMRSMHRCRVISRYGIGTDKLAVDVATAEGIVVGNVPTFCSHEMGEHAMALLLAVVRQLPRMAQSVMDGAWTRGRRLSIQNHRMVGRVLGLVGFGDSAQAMAVRAKSFGVKLLATRRNMNADSPLARELGVHMVDLDTLVAESDYISLHLPLAPETYHLFDAARLQQMKPGAILINVARGALVDEIALAKALREGRLSGAGIDTYEDINVFSEHEAPPHHPLLELDNVVLSPHIAALSVESMRDLATGAVENLVSVLTGHWPKPGQIVNTDVVPRQPLAEYDDTIFCR